MSAPIAKSQMSFALPNLSYVDAKWEEPNLRAQFQAEPKRGIFAWIAHKVAGIVAWNRQQEQAAELAMMNDRELADIGLNRGDVGRVFTPEHSRDMIALRGADV
ncbi:MAG: DUF1127 domain-containing protein [Acetobacteraceae bacterium]